MIRSTPEGRLSPAASGYLVLLAPLLALGLYFGHTTAGPQGLVDHFTIDVADHLLVARLATDRRGSAIMALEENGTLHVLTFHGRTLADQTLTVPFADSPERWRLQLADIDHDGLVELLVFDLPRGLRLGEGRRPALPCALFRHDADGWRLVDREPRTPFQRSTGQPTSVTLDGRGYAVRVVVGADPSTSLSQLLDPVTQRPAYILDGVVAAVSDLDRDGQPEVLTAQTVPGRPETARYRLLTFARGRFRPLWSGVLTRREGRGGNERVLGSADLLGTGNADWVLLETEPGRLHLLSLKPADASAPRPSR